MNCGWINNELRLHRKFCRLKGTRQSIGLEIFLLGRNGEGKQIRKSLQWVKTMCSLNIDKVLVVCKDGYRMASCLKK